MKTISNAACAAIALSCLSLAGPVMAGDVRETVQVRVSRTGLDMTDAGHRARFHARVARAARGVCHASGATLASRLDSDRCVAEMHRDADRQIAMLVGRSPIQLAAR
ncbi:MAG: UrcA family protein [Pseudomonadota bacterium]